MKIEVDTHTHTILTGHAFSTLLENIEYAKKIGLKGLCITDHGPLRPDSPSIEYFKMLASRYLPEYIDGIKIFTGVELNIISDEGDVDLPESIIKNLDFNIIAFHNQTPYSSNSIDKNTKSMINALKRKYIKGIAHPGDPYFPYPINLEEIVKVAGDLGKFLELNNNVLKRGETWVNYYKEMLYLCEKYKVKVFISSDAHFSYYVGDFSIAINIIKDFNIKVINERLEEFEKLLKDI
ncbi:MAG: PHP domain-containing protein [Caldisericia bacterium]|nr:PHP domain-containing protein [Caldisericia bacterium]